MIYIVEDDDSIRDLVLYALKNEGQKCTGVRDFDELLEELKKNDPELFLLDIMIPKKDGLSILKWIRESEYKDVPVIMLTAKTSEIDRVRGLDLGADDYVTKPFSVLELMARVRANLRRKKSFDMSDSKDTIEVGEMVIYPSMRKVLVNGEEVVLGYKEFELLSLLARNKGIVMSREKIMELNWGYDYIGETRTIDVHIAYLRGKLGAAAKYIKTIRNVGYVLEA